MKKTINKKDLEFDNSNFRHIMAGDKFKGVDLDSRALGLLARTEGVPVQELADLLGLTKGRFNDKIKYGLFDIKEAFILCLYLNKSFEELFKFNIKTGQQC